MNQIYKLIKPVRTKPLDKKGIGWVVDNRPCSTVVILSTGYTILFGFILGWCIVTIP